MRAPLAINTGARWNVQFAVFLAIDASTAFFALRHKKAPCLRDAFANDLNDARGQRFSPSTFDLTVSFQSVVESTKRSKNDLHVHGLAVYRRRQRLGRFDDVEAGRRHGHVLAPRGRVPLVRVEAGRVASDRLEIAAHPVATDDRSVVDLRGSETGGIEKQARNYCLPVRNFQNLFSLWVQQQVLIISPSQK